MTKTSPQVLKATLAAQGKHWKWPDARNRWHTNAKRRGKKQAYSGPSKRTRGRRARRGNSGHSYN